MDLNKMFFSGLKSFLYVLLATICGVMIGALTLALGYQPQGLLNQTVFTYVVVPILTGIIAALKTTHSTRTTDFTPTCKNRDS